MSAILMFRPSQVRAVKAGRLGLHLFPDYKKHGLWLYAVGFSDGRVKVGIASNPRSRMLQYWNHVGGAIDWAHLFEQIKRPSGHRMTANVTERLAVTKCAAAGERIGNSEYFRNLSKADALRCCREAIAERRG